MFSFTVIPNGFYSLRTLLTRSGVEVMLNIVHL